MMGAGQARFDRVLDGEMQLTRPIRRVARTVYHRLIPERIRLIRAWARHPAESLDQYLVSGYQDPHVNVQSILLRHRLARRLFGTQFDDLIAGEIVIAIELNEILQARAEELGVSMGAWMDPAKRARVLEVSKAIADRQTEFAGRWRTALAGVEADPVRVLEFACGSANDYRAIAEYGLARFLDYRGVDLNAANIANAKRRFPEVDFRQESILNLSDADGTFDLVIAADLFEHLSLRALERALGEAMRLGRRGVILTFFNMADIPDHVVHPKRGYHLNQLSRPRIEARLRSHYPVVEVIDVARWLAESYGYDRSYNPSAFTIVASDA
jgi:SAM-dependent methyltransferase